MSWIISAEELRSIKEHIAKFNIGDAVVLVQPKPIGVHHHEWTEEERLERDFGRSEDFEVDADTYIVVGEKGIVSETNLDNNSITVNFGDGADVEFVFEGYAGEITRDDKMSVEEISFNGSEVFYLEKAAQ